MIKRSSNFYDTVSLFYLGLSVTGLILLPFLTFIFQKTSLTFAFQKCFIGATFIGICLVGILVGIFPSKCSQILHFRELEKSDTPQKIEQTLRAVNFNGHHPVCDNFTAHVLPLGGKLYCAGCTGLVTGAIFSIFFSIQYYFFDLNIGAMGSTVFWFGFFDVLCGLLQHQILFRTKSPQIKVFTNTLFVVGSCLLLVGVHEITSNILIELYVIILILYWIVTRMYTSQIRHNRICANCSLKSCRFV